MKKISLIKAFTLVELVIVIGIIGVMTAIPVIAYSEVTKRARDTRRKQDIEKVNTALTQYRTENGKYPITDIYTELGTILVPVYLSYLPMDPRGGASYLYSSSDGYFYAVGAILESTYNGVNERYYSTANGGMTITGTPVAPTAFPTDINPLSIAPTQTPLPTPSFTPTPTP